MPRSAKNSTLSASSKSAISASIAAHTATTGAPSLAACWITASKCGLLSKPSSLTLAIYIAGFAVIKHKGFKSRFSSSVSSRLRTGWAWSKWACTLVSTATKAAASLSLPDLAALLERCSVFSTVVRSDKANSVSITAISEIGSILPATWITFASSKQRTTWVMASVSRIFAKNWFPRPSPLDAPATKPAISTNSTAAGRMRSGFTISAKAARRGSGTSTTPTLGSIVQKG